MDRKKEKGELTNLQLAEFDSVQQFVLSDKLKLEVKKLPSLVIFQMVCLFLFFELFIEKIQNFDPWFII